MLQDEWRIALAAAVTARQRDADLDPYDPKAVEGYVPVSRDAAGSLGMPLQADDLILRLQRLLTALPYAPGVWALPGDLAQRDGGLSEVDLALIERVEPWYLNAVVYSN